MVRYYPPPAGMEWEGIKKHAYVERQMHADPQLDLDLKLKLYEWNRVHAPLVHLCAQITQNVGTNLSKMWEGMPTNV